MKIFEKRIMEDLEIIRVSFKACGLVNGEINLKFWR